MEAAGTVLEVLSVSFGTLQKAVAGRPREQAKRARSEQLMQVKAGGSSKTVLQKAPARPRASGSCREGFGGAIRQFRNPTKSCGWKAKGARSEQLMQVCSESRWKLQGRFWRCYPSVSEPYKKLWLEGQGSRPREPGASSKCQWKLQRVLEVLSVSFETLQKAPARPRASALEAAERVLEVLSVSFGTLHKAVAGRPRESGASS